MSSSRIRQITIKRALLAAAAGILFFALGQLDFRGMSFVNSSSHAAAGTPTGASSNASADLAISMTSPTTGPVLLGQLITYDLTVTNNGPDAASQVTITFPIPSSATLGNGGSPPTGADCGNVHSGFSGTIICTIASVPSGGTPITSEITLVPVNASAAGQFTFTVSVASATSDPNSNNNSSSVTTTVSNSSAVPTTTVLNPFTAPPGVDLTLEVDGTNFTQASQILLDGVPFTTTFIENRKLTTLIHGSDIASPQGISVFVKNPTPGGGISNAQPLSITSSNQSADLQVTITADPGPVLIGQAINYSVTVTNNGPNTATPANLTIPVPDGMVLGNGNGNSPPGATCDHTGNGSALPLNCTFDTLAPGASSTGSFPLAVVSPIASATVTAGVAGGTPDPILTNNSSTAVTPVTNSYAVPTTNDLEPNSAATGGSNVSFQVKGTNFTLASVVLFNGTPHTTTFTDNFDLQVALTASDLATPGSFPVVVTNPAPGGGTSSPPLMFTVGGGQSQTITFNPILNHTFGDQPFTLNATASSGLAVVFSLTSNTTNGAASINGNTLTITGAGQVEVQADQPGNATFSPAPFVRQSFSVAKEGQSISFPAILDKKITDSPITVNATATSGLSVTFSITGGPATISGSTVTLTGTGVVTVEADQAGNQNFDHAPPISRSFNVTKGDQTISFSPLPNKNFGDSPFNLIATATSGLPVTFSVTAGQTLVNLSGNTVTIVGAGGPVTIQADQGGNSSFSAAPSVQQSFTIGKENATLTLSTPTQIADGNPASASVTTNPPGLSGVTITYTGINVVFGPTTNAPTDPGHYTVVASLSNPNFQANNVSGTMRLVLLSPTDLQSANPGSSVTASVLPAGSSPGITLDVNHTPSGVATNVKVGIFNENPTDTSILDVGGGFVIGKINHPNADDTGVLTFYYPSSITGQNETLLQLFYFNGSAWVLAKDGSGNPPIKDTTDNLDGTTSGGKFTLNLSGTSSPKITDFANFLGIDFTVSTVVSGDVTGDGQVTVSDLVVLANIIAGNITPTPAQKQAGDVFQDGQITIQDLVTLANFIAGNIHSLPVVPAPVVDPGNLKP